MKAVRSGGSAFPRLSGGERLRGLAQGRIPGEAAKVFAVTTAGSIWMGIAPLYRRVPAEASAA